MWSSRAALAAALLVGGCGSAQRQAQRTQEHASLIGSPESDVIRQYGKPSRSYEQGSVRTLIYDSSDVEFLDNNPRFAETPAYANAAQSRTTAFGCRLYFTLAAGVVRSFDQQGGGC